MSEILPQELRAEIRRVTGAIAKVFTVDGDLAEADAESLHNQLIACIEAVNARLQICDELLRKGLRYEAIQECEVEPHLLDLVTELDIAEGEAWAHYVRQFGIPRQPELFVDVAAELNEAYSQAESLDGLLRLHRLHALARSPLSERLAILRQIASRDGSNATWSNDLKAYEQARFQEAENDLRKLRSENDLRGLSELRKEMTESTWTVEPPKTLVERVVQSHQRMLIEDARVRLAELEPSINAAFSEFNVARATRARREWEKYADIAGLSSDDPLSRQVQAAFEWLDEEELQRERGQDFERAKSELEVALDDSATDRPTLIRLFNVIERFDEPIPERLHRRFAERVRSLELSERRRGRLIISGLLATIAMIGAIAFLIIVWQIRGTQIATACEGMERLLDEGKLEEASAYYTRAVNDNQAVKTASRMQQLYSQLEGRIAEDKARSRRLQETLAIAAKSMKQETFESVSLALKQVQDSEKLTRTESELAEVKALEREVRQHLDTLQRKVDTEFQTEVARILDRAKLRAKLADAELEDLLRDANHAHNRPRVSASLRQSVGLDVLTASLRDEIKRRADEYGKQQELNRLYDTIGRIGSYELALRNYLKLAPNSPRSTDFQQVLDHDIPQNQTVDEWNGIAAKWNSLSTRPEADFSKKAQQVIGNIKGKFTKFPTADSVLAMSNYIDSIGNRTNSSGISVLESIQNILNADIFSMNYLKDDSGSYYFLLPPQEGPQSIRISVLRDVRDLSIVRSKAIVKAKVKSLPDGKFWDTAPHDQYAKKAIKLLNQNEETYEFRIAGAVTLLFENKEVDPILKCGLMQTILDKGMPGSTILGEEFARLHKSIKTKTDLSDINWLTTDEATINTMRELTAKQLERVPESEQPRNVYMQRIAPRVKTAFEERPHLARLEWVGILMKNSQGVWQCQLSKEAPTNTSGELVVGDFTDETSPGFRVIGQSDGGRPVLRFPTDSSFVEGRPVYMLQ